MRRPSIAQPLARATRTSASLFLAGVLSLGALAGCAPVQSGPTSPDDPSSPTAPVTFELARPVLIGVAPTAVALGDEVKVFGKDFIDPDHGVLALHMKGSFRSDAGQETRWEGDVPLTYASPGQATFEFGPSILFAPTGLDLGTFSGNFQVVSKLTSQAVNAEPGDMEISEPQALQLVAKPSLLIEQLRSVDQPCQLVTTGTNPGVNIAIGVRALGFGKGTPGAPITFSFTFRTPEVAAAFAENKTFSSWPLTNTPSAMLQATDGTYTLSYNVDNDDAATLDPAHYEQVVTVDPPISVNQTTTSLVKLARLAAGALQPMGANKATMNFVVRASRPDGTELVRTVHFDNYEPLELRAWNGLEKDKEVYPLTQTNCSSGGLTGQQYSYSEGTSDSRSRSLTMNWNIMNSAQLDANVWILRASATSTQTFGVDVNQSVTTESHTNFTTTINVLPGWVGASFRQPVRAERKAPAVLHNSCGVTTAVGDMVLTNWRWNYDINQAQSCEVIAPSDKALPVGPR